MPPAKREAAAVVASLRRLATKKVRDGMARYAIPSDNAFGVSMGTLQTLAKELGRDHALALSLWQTGWYEARMLACLLDEPAKVTVRQMDRWCRDFDSWAICDTACFHLFDRTPHAFARVEAWSRRDAEFVKRGAFALLASLALHDKSANEAMFRKFLPDIERAADDVRNFVKKGVSWALRAIGRRSPALKGAALTVAGRMAKSATPSARWVGKDALRDLTRKS